VADSSVGRGTGIFLGHLASGITVAALRENWKGGSYPDLSPKFARANLVFKGLAK
jgi:hypothetical protein